MNILRHWHLLDKVEIRKIVKVKSSVISHVLRSANENVDRLAKKGEGLISVVGSNA